MPAPPQQPVMPTLPGGGIDKRKRQWKKKKGK